MNLPLLPSLPLSAPQLRAYQLAALDQLDAAIAEGALAPLLVLPTGAGKTVIASELIRRTVARGSRALFLAPRRELVTQASRAMVRSGVEHGLLLAGQDGGRNLYAPVQVGSIDTLLARMVRTRRLAIPDPQLIVIDEAHLAITAARQSLLGLWPNAIRVGLTATPTRRDGRALGQLFDRLIEPVTTAELTRDGYLVPARYFSLSAPDLARVRTVAGDYHAGDLASEVNRTELVADVVATWLARAAGRRTVVFAVNITHSVALCEAFLRAGVAAEHVDASTPQSIRDEVFARFTSGTTQVLTNCSLASYGFDLPELSCVVLARPTKSLMLYLQMIGRGLRIATDKRDCLVLDHAGAVHRFGFPTYARAWTLEGERALVSAERSKSSERKDAKQIDCPECKAVFTGARLCPECGYFFAPKGKEIRTLAGELVEIGEHLPRVQQDQAVFFAELRGMAIERHWKPGFAAVKFRERFGAWPPRDWEAMPLATPSSETRRWVQSRFIAWRKSQNSGVAA